MKKQHLKRFGYGISALALGLSAVNFFPVADVHANTGYDLCSEEDTSPCFVDVTAPDSLEYTIGGDALVFSGSFNGDLIVQVDGEPYTDGLTLTDAHHFTFDLEFDTVGNHEVKFLVIERVEAAQSFNVTVVNAAGPVIDLNDDQYKLVEKTVNVGDSFTVEARAGSAIYKSKVAETDDEEKYDYWYRYVDATDEELTVVESSAGQYDVMPLVAGQYTIRLTAYDFAVVDGTIRHIFYTTEVYMTAVDARTEAATTITDIMNAYSETYADYWNKYVEIMRDNEMTAEQKEAAVEALEEETDKAQEANELREVNAFRDDADAIWEAVDSGKAIATAVSAEELAEANVDATVKNALLEKLDATFASNVKYYDIDVNVYADGELIGTLKELTGEQVVVLSGFEAAPAGYKRVYKILGYHTYIDENGDEQVEIVEIDDVEYSEEIKSIIFGANKFSTYLVAYNDVFAPSVNAGAFTGEGASASTSVITPVVTVVAAIVLAGVFKFAKARK